MDIICIVIISVLFLCAVFLLVRLILLKKQIRIFTQKIKEKKDNDNKEPLKVITFDKDITELAGAFNDHFEKHYKDYAEYVKEKEKMNLIVTGISHDFRTPLTASLGYLQLIEKSGELKDPRNIKNLEIATQKNLYLKKLSDDFFDLSKMSFGKDRKLNITTVELTRILEESALQFYDLASEKNLDVSFNIDKNIKIDADEHELTRIFDNLIGNSVKYAKSYVSVVLKGRMLTVENDMEDPDSVDTERIFEPFYRSSSRNMEGTGLGLYVVKDLMQEMGFEITAKKKDEKLIMIARFD